MLNKFPGNDALKAFGLSEGYTGSYNDMLYKYLKERYIGTHGGKTLTDLMNVWDGELISLQNPTAFTGNVLWLDASDTSTLTLSGSDVTVWADKSGQGNDAVQDGASAMPQSGNNDINGKNVLNFTAASSERLTLGQPASLDFEPGTDEFTLIFVVNFSSVGTQCIFSKAGATSAQRQYACYMGNTGMYRSVIGGAFNSTNTDYSGSPQVCITAVSTTNNETTVTGNFLVSNSILSASSNVSDVLIGGRRNDDINGGLTWQYDSDIGEIIVYNRFMTNSELEIVCSKIQAKWGIT